MITYTSCTSEHYVRSERLIALNKCNSLRGFEANALKEAGLICNQLKDYIGDGFRPCEPYISHIFQTILTKKRAPDPDDICDYGGSFLVPIEIKKFNDTFKNIEFIILPEVLTEFVMETKYIIYRGYTISA